MNASAQLSHTKDAGTDGYRAVSGWAVTSAAAALLSPLALLDWPLGVFPALGMLLGAVALVSIGRRPDELTGERVALGAVIVSGAFLCAGWARLGYLELTEVPPGYHPIDYDLLQPKPGEPADAVPAAALALEGHKVYLRGYAFPGAQSKGIKQFVLVRDNQQCCFGGNPKLTDMVDVTLDEPLTMEYSPYLRRVAGTFHVEMGEGVDGLPRVLYHLKADHLR
jgi:hypothetical protein